jgi:small subunit ribosomal protein S4
LVKHSHVKVNDKKVNIPSFMAKEGDVVSVAEKGQKFLRIETALKSKMRAEVPDWLAVDDKQLTAKVNYIPSREDISLPIREQLIVELYSK